MVLKVEDRRWIRKEASKLKEGFQVTQKRGVRGNEALGRGWRWPHGNRHVLLPARDPALLPAHAPYFQVPWGQD